jgi:multicomponent Na+:H+ antiporter subunit E
MRASKPIQDSGELPARDRHSRFKHSLILWIVLFGIWLLWSGQYDEPLLIGFGGGSCLMVVLLSRRMGIVDAESVPVQLGLRPFIGYLPWLSKEIILANIDVARRVLDPRLPISPRMIRVKASQKEDLGQVVYANSITLTPGTVAVDMAKDEITVHALTREAAQFDESGEMDRRVTKMEGLR